MMSDFLQVTVRLDDRPLRLLIWLIVLVPIYLFYRYMRDLQRKKQQLIILQKTFENTVLQTEIKVREQTFQKISQDMHDNIGQKISVAMLSARSKAASPENNNEIAKLLGECLHDLRDLSKSLSWDLVTTLGLSYAMEEEVYRLQKMSLLNVSYKTTGEPFFLTPTYDLVILRIFQEALQNAVKHSQATKITIELVYGPKRVSLIIKDNGIGFDAKTKRNSGLRHMADRAGGLEGTLEVIQLKPGTEILVKIPFPY